MTTSSEKRHVKEAMAAVAIALWIHVGIFLVLVLLLFWQLLSSLVVKEEPVMSQEATEVVISMEPDFSPLVEMAKEKAEVVSPENELLEELKKPAEPKFVRTAPDQAAGKPDESALIGERDTVARSEAGAQKGKNDAPAFQGEDSKKDIQSVDDRFQNGKERGSAAKSAMGAGNAGEDQKAIESQKVVASKEAVKGEEEAKEAVEEVKMEEFLAPEIVEESLPTPEELEKEDEAKKMVEAREEMEKQEERAKKQAGGGAGEFHSQARKTLVLGSLNASGEASLNVKKTALGKYQQVMFREIERGWQEGNFQYRSHLVPGTVSARFVVDAKGNVSGQRRMDMQGASQMQWGLILRALEGAKIPAMPAEVRKELNGQELELSITFNY